MKHQIVRFLGIQFVAYIIIACTLLCGWASAAPSDYQRSMPGCHAFESECSRRPLLNGRPGETVEVCERVKLVCDKPARQGVTTVYHVGRGAL